MRLNASELEGLSPAQRVKKFDDAHGDFVIVDNTILFEDAAWRALDPWGCLAEPPNDDGECCKRIVKFTEAKLALAREEFSIYKNNLTQQCHRVIEQKSCNNPPEPPSAEAVAKLKELRKKCISWQTKLTAARKKIEATIPENIKVRNEFCEQNRQKAADISAEIQNIEI